MKKINIGGKELPCRMTLGAMLKFKREKGKDVSQLDKDLEDLAFLLWCCVVSACKADGIEYGDSFEDFCDKIDANDLNTFYGGMEDESKKKTN